MLLAPMPTFAASATFLGPIVPQACHCDNQTVQGATDGQQVNSAPDWGCVLQVIQNLVNFGVTLAMTLFTIYLVITGFSFITSAGSSEARSKAKTRFANVFIGLAVMLCAWLIVDFVMKQLYNPDATVTSVSGGTKFGPWNAILAGTPGSECIRPTKPTKVETGVLTMIATSTGSTQGTTGGGSATGATGGNTGLNIGKATQHLVQNAQPKPTGYCARFVCAAINAGGVSMGCANASALGANLLGAKYQAVYNGVYSDSAAASFSFKAGDVVVFQPVGGHPNGHTAMYTGSQWVSDYVQSRMDPGDKSGGRPYLGSSFTVYRP